MSVFDKLADWATGDDSWDTQAHYRDWLANVFGPKTGEVIARGLPRLADFDMSHAGEGNLPDRILPFMQLLTEKRKMEDAEGDLLKHLSGSAAGLLMRSASGVRDMSRGDFLKGAIKVLPELFRGPLEATQYAQAGGLMKKNGEVDPRWKPTSGEIAATAFGVDPSGLAEAEETSRDAAGLAAMRQEHEQVISQHLATAFRRGDQPGLQHWAAQSMDYAREHPGFMPPVASLGEALERQMMAEALSRATGMPIGVSLHDLATRRAVGTAVSASEVDCPRIKVRTRRARARFGQATATPSISIFQAGSVHLDLARDWGELVEKEKPRTRRGSVSFFHRFKIGAGGKLDRSEFLSGHPGKLAEQRSRPFRIPI